MSDPVGEDGWLALVDEASRTAGDLEQRIGVVELYKRAIAAEPWSNKLWLAYCEWVWSLYTDCQNGDAGWPEDEQQVGQELFPLEMALDVWTQGAQATQYRLNDSHELWNRWMSIELGQLPDPPNQQSLERVRNLFLDRLQIPHANWDETSQMFSTFISKYDQASYESTMVQVTKLAKDAKDIYEHREKHELKLRQAINSGDSEAVKQEMKSYLHWEHGQAIKKTKKGAPASLLILCVALYERALCSTSLGSDPHLWEEYVVFLSDTKADVPDAQLPAILPVMQRATNHCPWSGTLWARYILYAESEDLPFSTMEQIKHAATNTRELDRDGMASVVEFYIAWSGYLTRLAMVAGANDENIDVADMGLPTALEDVQQWGKRRHGGEWKGDPMFRIERLIIQHLTQKNHIDGAREFWRKLVKTHNRSYDFWEQYYLWEMSIRHPTGAPKLATSVLVQAVNTKGLDWPERMLEICIRHCQIYEDVDTLLKMMSVVHQKRITVAKQREAEAVLYAQQQQPMEASRDVPVEEGESPSGATKRKRESEEVDGAAKKKMKSVDQDALREQHLKRDRENTTVLVTNLPREVAQPKVRQYFKEYGHINSITVKSESDKLSSTALIEFRTPEEARSALLRDAKYFVDKQISVVPGTGLTLFVTNFPPTADDAYLHNLFKDCGEIFSIRWPSLKANTHRRFCYLSFKTAEAAAAATQLHGKSLGGFYKLSAQYSDPANKKDREGAMADGRELHFTGLDFTITEAELEKVFSKYGKVEKCRILRDPSGESKGAGFVSFETKEQATAALELDSTKLKARILKVELSVGKNFKPTATTGKASSMSPAPEGQSATSPSPGPAAPKDDARNRTMAILDVPDTVNDSRIRAIAEPYGEIVKLSLRLDHQGAIVEYSDAAAAGKAALGLAGYEIVPGRMLRTGGLRDLFAEKEEVKTDKIQIGGGGKKPAAAAGSGFMQPAPPIRRPGTGSRGGLGQKRGLGFSKASAPAPLSAGEGVNGQNGEEKKPKSNADFKAMFVRGGTE
ncbi:related to pre-mRNA splicing factor [Phialocephala subalpina]|uniref:U4/U6 snRNA-associated-splicing factor PRP24 n=1 Tax=Phialocephala subalpina TaxID=576137 RepID=A0A1L7X6A1_9HELO|nr:related to pre-mRNA splicing factor [Phialocephala subalpina]